MIYCTRNDLHLTAQFFCIAHINNNIDVVSVMAEYAAITLTTSITTRTLVPDM